MNVCPIDDLPYGVSPHGVDEAPLRIADSFSRLVVYVLKHKFLSISFYVAMKVAAGKWQEPVSFACRFLARRRSSRRTRLSSTAYRSAPSRVMNGVPTSKRLRKVLLNPLMLTKRPMAFLPLVLTLAAKTSPSLRSAASAR